MKSCVWLCFKEALQEVNGEIDKASANKVFAVVHIGEFQ